MESLSQIYLGANKVAMMVQSPNNEWFYIFLCFFMTFNADEELQPYPQLIYQINILEACEINDSVEFHKRYPPSTALSLPFIFDLSNRIKLHKMKKFYL